MKLPATRLVIRQTPGPLRPLIGSCILNEVRGGPESLLQWLETQLGLPTIAPHRANCVTEFASAITSALQADDNSAVMQSMRNDRWATACELLARNDELTLAGWEHESYTGNDPMITDLKKIKSSQSLVFLSVAERLKRTEQSLIDGQRLPPHSCELHEPIESWPIRWQSVLKHLSITSPSPTQPQGKPDTTLRAIQDAIASSDANPTSDSIQPLLFDASLRCVQTLSQNVAIEFVAAFLANNREELHRTVIVCEDEYLSMQLDAAFARYQLPTMGASVCTTAHPALQILPLALSLCWEPVDPQRLLDFLTLPFSPIPKKAATALAHALSAEPGLGSGSWEDAVTSLCTEELDPDEKLKERIDLWLHAQRFRHDSKIPTSFVKQRCAIVAKWAQGQIVHWEQGDDPNLDLSQAFQIVAGQASLLGEIAECQGTHITQPQLWRLLEEAITPGIEACGRTESVGGTILVRSLAGIVDPCHRVIWIGLGTGDIHQSTWHSEQRVALKASGVSLDDGTSALSSLRMAEMRGILQIEDSLLAIVLPQDRDKRSHPLWLTVQSYLEPDKAKLIPIVEDLIQTDQLASIQPFSFPTELHATEPAQPIRPLWTVDPALLKELDTVSATELEEQLACPLKWTLRNNAKLYPSSIAQLPDNHQLKGSFCHRILEYAFGEGGPLPSVDEAVARAEQLFDSRIERDAAPLAQPERFRERNQLRDQLANATRALISCLASEGYRIVGIEVPIDGFTLGKTARGSIDCLVEDEHGCEAIIDFKFSGKKYGDLLREGKCIQLAMYANHRCNQKHEYPKVGYLVLDRAELLTHREDAIGGDGHRTLVDGPSIREVWHRFSAAIAEANDWLTGHGQIPARPLQSLESLPECVTIVLKPDLPPNEIQSVCKYCNYSQLCGTGGLE